MDGYVATLERAVDREDGASMADCVSLTSHPALGASVPSNVDRLCRARLGGKYAPYAAMAGKHLLCLRSLHGGDAVTAYLAQAGVLEELVELLKASPTNWLVAPLHAICLDSRLLSARADAAVAAAGGSPDEHQKGLATALQQAFSATINHRSASLADSKKWGALYVTNTLFKMYFKLNTLRLCNFLVKSVNGPGFPPFAEFPVSHRVTYRFYVGRLAMFEDRYSEANEHLTYALRHCHKAALRNKRLILQNLIPVRLQLGMVPRASLLAKYGLDAFTPVAEAVVSGNVRQFDDALRDNRDFFVRKGVYLLLERLQMLVYRTLFMRIFQITGSTRVDLVALRTPLAALGIDMDEDELECVLANLIYRKLIRGYISHSRRTLVVAKDKAYPRVRTTVR